MECVRLRVKDIDFHYKQIIIRDADKDLQKRHLGTRFTEFFSTRSGFNKSINKKLCFFSGRKIAEIAGKYNMEIEIIDRTRLTSNLIYVLKHRSSVMPASVTAEG